MSLSRRLFIAILSAGLLFAFQPTASRADLPPLIPRAVLFGNPVN